MGVTKASYKTAIDFKYRRNSQHACWTVLEEVHPAQVRGDRTYRRFKCRCTCGNEEVKSTEALSDAVRKNRQHCATCKVRGSSMTNTVSNPTGRTPIPQPLVGGETALKFLTRR